MWIMLASNAIGYEKIFGRNPNNKVKLNWIEYKPKKDKKKKIQAHWKQTVSDEIRIRNELQAIGQNLHK